MPATTRPYTRYDVLGLLVDIDDGLTRPNVSDASRMRYVRLVVARFKARHFDGLSAATLADWQRDGIDPAAEPGPPVGLTDDTDEAARAAARKASTV